MSNSLIDKLRLYFSDCQSRCPSKCYTKRKSQIRFLFGLFSSLLFRINASIVSANHSSSIHISTAHGTLAIIIIAFFFFLRQKWNGIFPGIRIVYCVWLLFLLFGCFVALLLFSFLFCCALELFLGVIHTQFNIFTLQIVCDISKIFRYFAPFVRFVYSHYKTKTSTHNTTEQGEMERGQ